MKKITLISMALLLILTLSLAGCKKADEASPSGGESSQTSDSGQTNDNAGPDGKTDSDSAEASKSVGEKPENSDPDKPADTVTVTTDYGTLYYPDMWDDTVVIDQSDVSDKLVKVTFSAKLSDDQTLELFILYIGEGGEEFGQEAGSITDSNGTSRKVWLSAGALDEKALSKLSESERDRCYGMQEDLNFVLDNLK